MLWRGRGVKIVLIFKKFMNAPLEKGSVTEGGHRKFAWRHSWILPNSVPVLSQDQNPDCQNPKPRTRIQNPEPEYFAKNRSHSLSFTCPVVANLSLDGELIRAGERLSRHKPNSSRKLVSSKTEKKIGTVESVMPSEDRAGPESRNESTKTTFYQSSKMGVGWSDLWFGAGRL